MADSGLDKAPDMITFTLGDEDEQMVVSIPEASIYSLEPAKKEQTVRVLSRFIVALGRGGNTNTFERDLTTVMSIEGIILTMPGRGQPLSIQELFGGLIASGSPEDLAQLQADTEES